MIKAYIFSALMYLPLHNAATARRGGVSALGGEFFLCLIAPMAISFVYDGIKGMFFDKEKEL